ncbi:hypothetical protein L3Q82_008342 [Scortum barcoo]|uniref:Uncharacterized protein n=1 Tax=Scortum barcoo TaxID=214431 RepID=A0ACB8WI89_9TELE|nr:hypothetical protein L3Q82_008342 [Scortum barcoo]
MQLSGFHQLTNLVFSTDNTDTAQLAMFVRGVKADLFVSEQLLARDDDGEGHLPYHCVVCDSYYVNIVAQPVLTNSYRTKKKKSAFSSIWIKRPGLGLLQMIKGDIRQYFNLQAFCFMMMQEKKNRQEENKGNRWSKNTTSLSGIDPKSIHPSIFNRLIRDLGRGGSSLSRDAQTSLTPDTSSSSSGGTPRRSQASRET